MAAPFDAYYTWLGIPPAEQPPHHYRLLGVPLFESDMAVIGNAADRQMVYVKTFLEGPHAETAKRLLSELRAARLCLFDAEQKGEYDATLRSASGPGGSNGAAGMTPAADGAHPHSRPMPRRGFSPWGSSANVGGQLPPPAMPPPIPPPAIAVPPQHYSPIYPSAPYVPPASAVLPSAVSLPPLAALVVPATPEPAPIEPSTPSATLEAQRAASRPVPIEKPVPTSPVESHLGASPTGALLRDRQSRFRDTLLIAISAGLALLVGGIGLAYMLGGGKTGGEKVVARKDRGGQSQGSPTSDSGDEEGIDPATSEREPPSSEEMPAEPESDEGISDVTPSEPNETPAETAEPEDVPDKEPADPKPEDEPSPEPVKKKPPAKPIKVKPPRAIVAHLEGNVLKEGTELLKELSVPYRPGDPLPTQLARVDQGLALIKPLLVERHFDDADKLTKRIKDIGERLRDKDLLALAQAAQVEVNRMKTVQPALETLKTSPADKRANTLVGKHLCLAEGNFPLGLAHLAKGEEGQLRDAARLDLKSPTDPNDQAKLADDWFALGEKESEGYLARAAVWYVRALPELSGIPKLRTEKNLRGIAGNGDVLKMLRRPGVGVIASPAQATLKVSERRKFPGHTGGALFVAFSPDRKTLLSSGADDTIKLWDLVDGMGPVALTGHTGPVGALAVVDEGKDGKSLFSSSADGTLRMWVGTKSKAFQGDASRVTYVAASSDGRSLASGGSDGSLSFWGLAGGKERNHVSAHDGPVKCLAFSPDGRTLASAGDDTVKLWTLLGQLKATLDHSAKVNVVAFSPDRKLIASAGPGKVVELWSADKYDRREPLAGHAAEITSVAFSPDGCWLSSADADGEIIFWNPKTGKKQASISPVKDRIHCLAFSPDNGLLAAASEGGEILLLDLKVKYSAAEAPASTEAKE